MSQKSGAIDDAFFNDLSRQPQLSTGTSQDASGNGENAAPKSKRIACIICRRRKLKCDGGRPKCATCARLGHDCQYDEVRRKSGPKRGYVKDLEARLGVNSAQVETQLNKAKDGKKDSGDAPNGIPEESSDTNGQTFATFHSGSASDMPTRPTEAMPAIQREQSLPESQTNEPLLMPMMGNMAPDMMPDSEMMRNLDLGLDASFSWEMIGLGLEEPMPMQEAIDELRSRKYMDIDEMKGQGEAFVSLAHSQTWSLLSAYEFKMMYFPRAWMSVGRAARMVLMLGLNRVDGVGMDVKQCLPPPRDFAEREERRRAFWMAFCVDRYASIGTGWPMSIDERDIMTYLPVSEEAFENNIAQKAPTLHDAITPSQVSQLSSFAGVVFVTHFFGLNLTHLHRPEPNQREDDLNGEFWRRHHSMDNNLTQTNIMLPSHLRLPVGARNPNIVFLNFSIHTSTICLHQAAIFKAEKHNLPRTIVEKSRERCLAAATAIEDVMRQTCHIDVAGMNPFMAFCLYVAARVFVQYLKKNPQDSQSRTALQFLLTAMEAMKLKNPLTESFLVQLHLDIKGNGLDIFFHNPDYSSVYMDGKSETDSNGNTLAGSRHDSIPFHDSKTRCSPVVHLNESVSPEGQSPEDTRFPNDKITTTRQETPTLRAESPRQTQYAYRNIDLVARENSNLRPYHPENLHDAIQLHGIFNADSWSGASTTNGPIGINPLINNNITVNGFDTEMSDVQNSSTGLTPQSNYSYNHSSSNTSYSPQTAPDDDLTSTKAPPMPSMPSTTNGYPNQYTNFSSPSAQQNATNNPTNNPSNTAAPNNPNPQAFANNNNNNSNVQAQAAMNGMSPEDLFKNMQSWDMGASPGPLPGMTPGGEWEKMMDSMGQSMG
ncbi:hypothetical protein ACLMJK_003957 [Lecanora helva]